jgi:competence protein ComEA
MRKSLYIVAITLMLAVSSVALAEEVAPANGGAQQQVQGVVNINTADAAQLALLPRVGEKAAARIIEYRTQHGPFKKTTDLMQVKGFGAKTLERLSPYISLSGQTTLTAKVKSPSTRKPRAKKPATPAAS